MAWFDRKHTRAGRNKEFDLAAGNAGPLDNLVTPSAATKTLWIVEIVLAVTTYSAKTITFQDDAASPVPIGFMSIPAAAGTAAGEQVYRIKFGERGTPLTAGKNLDAVLSGAGVAGRLHIEAYEV